MREGFGAVAADEHSCLLEAAEEWGVQLGDALARAVTVHELLAAPEPTEEATCPQRQKLAQHRVAETLRYLDNQRERMN